MFLNIFVVIFDHINLLGVILLDIKHVLHYEILALKVFDTVFFFQGELTDRRCCSIIVIKTISN